MHAAFHMLYVPLLKHNVHERFAESAWFRVEAATLRYITRRVGNAMTSALAICAGYRLPWNRMKRLIQST